MISDRVSWETFCHRRSFWPHWLASPPIPIGPRLIPSSQHPPNICPSLQLIMMHTGDVHWQSQEHDIHYVVNVAHPFSPCEITRPRPGTMDTDPSGSRRLHRRPKSPCTSRRIRSAFRARTCAMSSRCEVSAVSTSLDVDVAPNGNCHTIRTNQPPALQPYQVTNLDLRAHTAANPRP